MTIPAFQPIPWQTVEDALILWANTVAGFSFHWANQNAPQPSYPFGTLLITSIRTIGIDAQPVGAAQGGKPASINSQGDRTASLSVQVSCHPDKVASSTQSSRAIMSAIQASLEIDDYFGPVRAAGAVVRGIGVIQNLDFVVDDRFISRAQLDISLGLASNVSVPMDVIDHAHVQSTFSPPVPASLEIDKDFP